MRHNLPSWEELHVVDSHSSQWVHAWSVVVDSQCHIDEGRGAVVGDHESGLASHGVSDDDPTTWRWIEPISFVKPHAIISPASFIDGLCTRPD